jgi:seryl-tRNA synthetase
MLDIKQVRLDPQAVADALNKKFYSFNAAEFEALDAVRKQADINSQNLLAERKKASKQIGELIKTGLNIDEAKAQVNETLAKIESELEALKLQAREANDALDQLLMAVPNLPADDVPDGKDESSNVEVLRWGEPRNFDFDVKDHVDVGETGGPGL